MVPIAGIEPARLCRRCLKTVCLPIPPYGQIDDRRIDEPFRAAPFIDLREHFGVSHLPMVCRARVELACSFERHVLSVGCLPIPPTAHEACYSSLKENWSKKNVGAGRR
jgi:hypothetical protein